MGLITGLFTLPLAPVRGVVWVAEQLYDEAVRELNDPAVIRRQLMAVQTAREDGTISEQEAAQQEEELVRRLWTATRTSGGGEV
ncbi:gas vesicle protein [Streptomyces tateyamensis]|uniref:Gas vesicle protein n=1 Tax=Streptomyces tateyamensis TaxID=565073 RepID=A0A2V4P9X5_9ACTN|nr:gas vesicle protein GvpG [Streptomyces tateyamensis]PYC87599.1 gas vesicle protein [Streptomyces tateyamensis]